MGFVSADKKVTLQALAPSTPTGRAPTLRATPPAGGMAPSSQINGGGQSLPLNFGSPIIRAIRFNTSTELGAPVAPTATVDDNVGQPGSENNAGNIAGASGNLGYIVQTVSTFQASNPGLSMLLRIGLPVAGVFLISKGNVWSGAAVAGAGALLWFSR